MTAPSWADENALMPEFDPTFAEVTLSWQNILKSMTRFLDEVARSSIVEDAALRHKIVLTLL